MLLFSKTIKLLIHCKLSIRQLLKFWIIDFEFKKGINPKFKIKKMFNSETNT